MPNSAAARRTLEVDAFLCDSCSTAVLAGESLVLGLSESQTVHRFRRKPNDPDAFEAVYYQLHAEAAGVH